MFFAEIKPTWRRKIHVEFSPLYCPGFFLTGATEFLPKEAECPNFIDADLIAAGINPFRPETDIIADISEAVENKKSIWQKVFDRLGSLYDQKFGGPDRRDKEKKFWEEKLKHIPYL